MNIDVNIDGTTYKCELDGFESFEKCIVFIVGVRDSGADLTLTTKDGGMLLLLSSVVSMAIFKVYV